MSMEISGNYKDYKFESETFKQLIGGSTASYACSMQWYKNVSSYIFLTCYFVFITILRFFSHLNA